MALRISGFQLCFHVVRNGVPAGAQGICVCSSASCSSFPRETDFMVIQRLYQSRGIADGRKALPISRNARVFATPKSFRIRLHRR